MQSGFINYVWDGILFKKTLVNLTSLSNQYCQNEKCNIWELFETFPGAKKHTSAHCCSQIESSTLSKIELGERQITVSMIQGLAEVLGLDYEELQIKYISEKILTEYKDQPYLLDSLLKVIENIKKEN
jgi:transcriptional regulator with XRE-family HTH domain